MMRADRWYKVTVALLCMLLPALQAQAEGVVLSVGSESASWRESIGSTTLAEESGWRQFIAFEAERQVYPRWDYGFRAKLYSGDLAFDGQSRTSGGTSYSSESDYYGGLAEVLFTYRLGPRSPWGLSFGVGYDQWRRDIDPTSSMEGYVEDYEVSFGRLALRHMNEHGWHGAVGLIAPLEVEETVQLSSSSLFDANAELSPGSLFSLNAEVGYRFERWELGARVDGYNFSSSPSVLVPCGASAGGCSVFQPDSESLRSQFYIGYRF